MSNADKHFYEFGPFRLDREKHRLTREGEPVPLPPKAAETLLVLVQHAGRSLEREELMQAVWADAFVEDANLTVAVSQPRKALGQKGETGGYIETIPRFGYRFTADVREVCTNGAELVVERHLFSRVTVEEQQVGTEGDPGAGDSVLPRHASSPPLPVTGPPGEAARSQRAFSRRRKPMALIGLTLSLGLAGAFAYRWARDAARPPQTSAEVKSVAVLPFRALGAGTEDDEYLGLGLADALVTQLGRTQQLVVRPTSAVRKYAEAEQDPLAVGRALGVEAVLECSTQRLGERLRVTARLLRVSDGTSLWAGKFDEKFTDIFAVQDSISWQVAQALAPGPGESKRQRLPGRQGTENIQAYRLYLKGHFLLDKWTAGDVLKAVQYFGQAAELDPLCARAYAGLADCYLALTEPGEKSREEAFTRAKALAEKAISLDATLAEPHTTLGVIRLARDWDYRDAGREFGRSLELDPNYPRAHQFFGVHQLAVGRTETGVAQTRRALELDPLSITNNFQLARALYFARRYDEAIEQGLRTLELDRNSAAAHVYLGQSYEQKGMLAEATAALQKAAELSGGRVEMKAALAHVYASAGKKGEALKLVEELSALRVEPSLTPYQIATVYAGLGDRDRALTWLEKAHRERDTYMALRVRTDPKLDGLRAEPRYRAILTRMGLDEF